MSDKKPKKATVADIIKNFGGNENFTKKRYRKRRKGGREPENLFKDQLYPHEDYQILIDILELPTAKFGYHYCLVATDSSTREFDIEPVKNKDSETVLKAFERMIDRKYISLPKYWLVSDQGSEFKGVFHRYLYDHNIFHKQTIKGRHSQLAPVDSLIATLGRIFNSYMNMKEEKSGKVFKNWIDIVPTVREELNKIRKVDIKKAQEEYHKDPPLVETATSKIVKKGKKEVIEYEKKKPKYKVGQTVYRLLEVPKNALGKDQMGKFREGDYRIDKTPHKISEIVYMNGQGPTFRYILDGISNVSYTEGELRKKL